MKANIIKKSFHMPRKALSSLLRVDIIHCLNIFSVIYYRRQKEFSTSQESVTWGQGLHLKYFFWSAIHSTVLELVDNKIKQNKTPKYWIWIWFRSWFLLLKFVLALRQKYIGQSMKQLKLPIFTILDII